MSAFTTDAIRYGQMFWGKTISLEHADSFNWICGSLGSEWWKMPHSDVTRVAVGVTQCSNWWRHPFFPQKPMLYLSHRQQSHPLPAFQLILSTVPFVKFSHIFVLSSGCHPLDVVPWGALPLSDATEEERGGVDRGSRHCDRTSADSADSKSSAVVEMAAQCCTTRIMKTWGGSVLEKIRRKTRVYCQKKQNLSAPFRSQTLNNSFG